MHRLRRLTSFISDTSSSLSIVVSRKASATSIYIYLSTVCMLVLLLFILSTIVQCINIALNLPYELNLYIRRRIANMWCINVAVALRLFVSGIQSSQFTSCCHFSRASIYLKNTSFVITLCAAALTQQGKWSSKTRRDSPFPLRILF